MEPRIRIGKFRVVRGRYRRHPVVGTYVGTKYVRKKRFDKSHD